MSRTIFLAAIAALGAGCSLVIDSSKYVGGGTNDGGQSDSGPQPDAGPNHDAGDDGGSGDGCNGVPIPPGSVLGFSRRRYVSATDEVAVTEDLSAYTIQAYVRDETEASGFRVIDGAGNADGTLRIDGIDEGTTYYLKLVTAAGGASFAETDVRCLDLDTYIGGRADAVTISLAQPVELHLDGMQPWGRTDFLVAEVYNTSTESWGLDGMLDTPPVRGATSIDGTYDWGCPACYSYRPDSRPALIDASAGDALQIAHARLTLERDMSGRLQEVSSTLDVVDIEGITMAPGATTTVNGTFSPVAQDQTVRFVFNRAAFDAGYTDGQTVYNGTSLGLYASPGTDRGINVGLPLAGVNLVDWSGTRPRSSTIDVRYGDAAPSEWPRTFDQRYYRLRWFRVPGARFSRPAPYAFVIRYMPFSAPVPSMPDVLPPGNLRVAEMPATSSGRVAFDGTAPLTVSWNPVASASRYNVVVRRAFDDAGRTAFAITGTLSTRSTSIDIPAEVFSGGEYFFFTVVAVRDGGLYASGQLRLGAYPFSQASTMTGLFRLSATCGDGTPQAGEACDPGDTSTASCDLDCTMPVCGDGLHNAAAGEECDSGWSTSACDDDCTLPVCGDGVFNPEVEDCDDGNAIDDGNGCSSTCRANNTCGDGFVHSALEDCDDGNIVDDGNGCTGGCRANNNCGDGIVEDAVEQCDTAGEDTATCVGPWCLRSTCGDGYTNGAAGETCDPPDGASCSASCTTL